MKPAPFAYHRPATIPEAVALLAELAPQEGRVLAGGQSLVPIMAFRLARPAHLIDINRVAGLDRLEIADGRLRIGAQVRHAAFHRPVVDGAARRNAGNRGAAISRIIRSGCAAHSAAASRMPTRRRNGASSRRHWMPSWSLSAGAASGPSAASDFFQGAMETALAPDELLVEARLPLLPAAFRFGFAEFSRRPGDYALAMALAVLEIEGGVITNAASRHRRRRGLSAPPRRGRGGPGRGGAVRGGIPRGGRDCRRC